MITLMSFFCTTLSTTHVHDPETCNALETIISQTIMAQTAQMILTFIRVLFFVKTLYQGQIKENEILPYIAEI